MTQLSDLTGAGSSDVLPGHILSKFGIREYGDAEREFKAQYLADASRGADMLPSEAAKRLTEAALDKVVGKFNWGQPDFDKACFATESFPFLLWLCLRIQNPKITRAQAAAIITSENQFQVQKTVLELAGFDMSGLPPKNAGSQSGSNPSTGNESSNSSETNADSTTTKSAA